MTLNNLSTRARLQETWIKVQEKYADRSYRDRPPCQLKSEADWERSLHSSLNVEWPCESAPGFWNVWDKIIAELKAAGIQAGPASFRAYNDGDAGLLRAIWCLIRHQRPEHVIETGVAHGLTSRVILEALESNGAGHLWSIDLPPMQRVWQKQVGMAVGDRFADRWTYMRGSSRRLLPELLSRLGQIDLFIHDSLHSERNVRFELDQAYAAVRPGGAIVVDDIDVNGAFQFFTDTFTGFQSMICDAEPIRPDTRRFNQKGLFGVVLKASRAMAATAAV